MKNVEKRKKKDSEPPRPAEVVISGIPRTGLSPAEERAHLYIRRRAPKDDFNLTFDRRRFLMDTHKGGRLLFRAKAIFIFLYIFTPFSFLVSRVESSRHVFRPFRTSAGSVQFRKIKKTRGNFFFILFYSVRPCPDFYLRSFIVIYNRVHTENDDKIIII